MFSYYFLVLTFSVVCSSDYDDLGYSLKIGNAIDVFANYGDLSQVTQVVSAEYDVEDDEESSSDERPEDSPEIFREKNIKVFLDVTSKETKGDPMVDMNVLLCDTFDDLLTVYFQNFKIEGTEAPWKAFLGDWIMDEIMRTFGIEYGGKYDNCCYVLVKMSKTHKAVELGDLKGVRLKDYVRRAVEKLNVSDSSEIRMFMKNYGTHYIDWYETGNFVYQVFKYKRSGYSLLKSYVRIRNNKQKTTDNLRFYFSSYFLKQVGDIRVASGNKTIETWARKNLRDSQYLYSRPSLLRLHYNPILAYKLNDLLDNGALLGLRLKTLRPLFEDKDKADKYGEVLENDLRLWEVNS